LALAAGAGDAVAGGQQIAVEVAPDGRALLVRTYRCGTPSEIEVAGVADGVVDGRHRSIPLEVSRTPQPGVFSVARQWPEQGAWVLTFTTVRGAFVNALVELRPGPRLQIAAQESTRDRIRAADVSAALRRAGERGR
jgi:hypothetical protein